MSGTWVGWDCLIDHLVYCLSMVQNVQLGTGAEVQGHRSSSFWRPTEGALECHGKKSQSHLRLLQTPWQLHPIMWELLKARHIITCTENDHVGEFMPHILTDNWHAVFLNVFLFQSNTYLWKKQINILYTSSTISNMLYLLALQRSDGLAILKLKVIRLV